MTFQPDRPSACLPPPALPPCLPAPLSLRTSRLETQARVQVAVKKHRTVGRFVCFFFHLYKPETSAPRMALAADAATQSAKVHERDCTPAADAPMPEAGTCAREPEPGARARTVAGSRVVVPAHLLEARATTAAAAAAAAVDLAQARAADAAARSRLQGAREHEAEAERFTKEAFDAYVAAALRKAAAEVAHAEAANTAAWARVHVAEARVAQTLAAQDARLKTRSRQGESRPWVEPKRRETKQRAVVIACVLVFACACCAFFFL